MTINITINADTLEITQVVDATKIVAGKSPGPSFDECKKAYRDHIDGKKLKPRLISFFEHLPNGVYFIRSCPTCTWEPMMVFDGIWTVNKAPFSRPPHVELLGPITPAMVM